MIMYSVYKYCRYKARRYNRRSANHCSCRRERVRLDEIDYITDECIDAFDEDSRIAE